MGQTVMTDRLTAEDLQLLDRIAAEAISPVDPPAALRAQVLEAVHRAPHLDESVPRPDESLTVRADEGTWKTIALGTRMKRLAKDGRRTIFLLDLDPHAVVAAHDHEGAEDTYVIRGSCHIGALGLAAGDFHHVEPTAHHGDVVASAEGCLLMITLTAAVAA
jgi:anti-sigma factor ChrR (cupin superfamily)